jgi:plastocyanin
MRPILASIAVVALLAALAVSASGGTPSVKWKLPASSTVKIKKGGSVKWVWADGLPHNVKGPGFLSKTSSKKGFAYSHKFSKAGTFKIICQIHGSSMKTTVKVS